MIITGNCNTPDSENLLIIDRDVLRDLFAAFALAGIAAANLDQDYSVDARMAYNYADAMLRARESKD